MSLVDYRITKIGDMEYKVCNVCDTINLANFECLNCRKAMRLMGCKGLIEIADIIDKRQGISTKIQCPRCENSEIEPDHSYCKICGLPLKKEC